MDSRSGDEKEQKEQENTFNFITFNKVAQQASPAMCGWAEPQFIKVNIFFRIVIILKIFCIFLIKTSKLRRMFKGVSVEKWISPDTW